jgi:leader peptidase (prepilin peptidase)/N-methyltransferase
MLAMDDGVQPYNLSRPRSHCPHCQTPLALRHNLPLLSFLVLRGRCAFCGSPIAWRYPLVEVSNALIWLSCGLWMPAGQQGFDAARCGRANLAFRERATFDREK